MRLKLRLNSNKLVVHRSEIAQAIAQTPLTESQGIPAVNPTLHR